MNEYYEFADGMCTYFVNVHTGEKKFKLDADDILVDANLDDFFRDKIKER